MKIEYIHFLCIAMKDNCDDVGVTRVRDDPPTIIHPNGDREWLVDGLWHCDNDLPAIEYANGDRRWCQNGRRHRGNGLPAVICANDVQEWWTYGHRTA